MRIPQVGESGWESCSTCNRYEGFRDCEIVAGPFFSKREAEQNIGGVLWLLPVVFPIFLIGTGTYSELSQLRRKPQQADTQAADESFQRDLKQMLAPSRVRS